MALEQLIVFRHIERRSQLLGYRLVWLLLSLSPAWPQLMEVDFYRNNFRFAVNR